MTASLLAVTPAQQFASLRRCGSPPAPWHASAAARRAVEALEPAFQARAPRVRTALARPQAFNAVARGRLFRAVIMALDATAPHRLHRGERHEVLTATALAPGLPHSHQTWEQPGIVVDTLLCLAGKVCGRRGIYRQLEVNLHACTRFVRVVAAPPSEPPGQ